MNLPAITTTIKTLPVKLVVRTQPNGRKVGCPNSMASK